MGSGPVGVDEWNGGFSLLWFRVSRREKRYAVGAEESLPRQISTPRKVAIASPIGRGYAGRHVGTARARIRIRQVATVMLVACMITPIFNLLTSEASLRSAIQGVFDGAFISLLVAGYLMFIRDGELRPWFRQLGFWTDLVLSSAIVLALFLVGRG